MMESEAYKAISCRATWLYLEIRKEWRGGDKNNIRLPYLKIKQRKHLHNTQISKAFIELEEYGFIDVRKRGGLFKNSSIYALSDKWIEFSNDHEQLRKIPEIIKAKVKRRRNRIKQNQGEGMLHG